VGIPDIERLAEVGEDHVPPVPSENLQPPVTAPADTEPDSETTAEEERPKKASPPQHEPVGDSPGEPASGRPGHRKIPSWAEAVDLVVSANVRTHGRDAESGSRRRGRGKGRRPSRGKKN
jgi:hypothetical protein